MDAELLGYTAIAIGCLGYLYKHPKDVMRVGLLAGVLWVFYFIALSLWIPTFIAVLAVIRMFAAVYFSDKAMQAVSLLICLIIVGVGLVTENDWIAFLPIIVAVWKTLSVWLRDHPIQFRLSTAGAEITYLIFALLVGADALAVSAIIVLLTTLGSAFRLYWQERSLAPTSV